MRVDPASDGWYVEYNGRYYHLTRQWCDEWARHQLRGTNNPAFNRLLAHWDRLTADDVMGLFPQVIDGPRAEKPARTSDPSDFQTWVAERGKR
jgi:hypothetical protein